MDAVIVAALIGAIAVLMVPVITRLIEKPGIGYKRFFCFSGILMFGFVGTIILLFNATSKYKTIIPDFGHTVRWPLQSNSSMHIERQKNLIFPKTLDWLSPKTIELNSIDYYQKDPNLLQALYAEMSRPVPLPTECLYLESHLRSINSWSGFMLSKYFDMFPIDLSQKSETLLILNADANDIIEIGLKDTRNTETKLKFPVKSGWHGYIIPTAAFCRIDMKCISLFLFAHSSTISLMQDNRFWIAYIGFR